MPNRILRDWTDSLRIDRLSWQAEVLFIRPQVGTDRIMLEAAKAAGYTVLDEHTR